MPRPALCQLNPSGNSRPRLSRKALNLELGDLRKKPEKDAAGGLTNEYARRAEKRGTKHDKWDGAQRMAAPVGQSRQERAAQIIERGIGSKQDCIEIESQRQRSTEVAE